MIAFLAIVFIVAPIAPAQFLPNLQARTPEEFDAYLDVAEARPETQIRLARRFLTAYPQSELRLRIYELLAEACRRQGQSTCASEAARQGLLVAPDYIPLLTTLGAIEANTSPSPSRDLPGRALHLLETAKAPQHVNAGTWLREIARLRAENLASLAIASFKGQRLEEAVKLLEESVRLSAQPANQYRLGMLYLELGRNVKARQLLEEAAKSPEPDLRDRALTALKRISSR
jgi:tetratricopeptide (TPR) repeat protein